MTEQTRTTLKAVFEDGDVPSGANYVDLIDSAANLSDTTAQVFTSDITVPTLNVTTVCAGTIFADTLNAVNQSFSGVVSADAGITVSGASILRGTTSAAALFADSLTISGAVAIAGTTSAAALFADSGTISGALKVAGTTSAAGLFADTLTISGATKLSGIVSADNGISCSGAVQLKGTTSAAAVFADSMTISGALKIAGTTSAAGLFADSITISGITTLAGDIKLTGTTSAVGLFADTFTLDGLLRLNAATTTEAGATAAYMQVNIGGTLRSIRLFATS